MKMENLGELNNVYNIQDGITLCNIFEFKQRQHALGF